MVGGAYISRTGEEARSRQLPGPAQMSRGREQGKTQESDASFCRDQQGALGMNYTSVGLLWGKKPGFGPNVSMCLWFQSTPGVGGREHLIFQVEAPPVLKKAVLWRRGRLWEVSPHPNGSWGWVPWPVWVAWGWHRRDPTPSTLVFSVLCRSTHLSHYVFHPGTVSLGFWLVTIPGQFTRGD